MIPAGVNSLLQIAMYVVYGVLAVFVIGTNSLTIAAVRTTPRPRLQTKTNAILTSHAVADSTIGVLSIDVVFYSVLNKTACSFAVYKTAMFPSSASPSTRRCFTSSPSTASSPSSFSCTTIAFLRGRASADSSQERGFSAARLRYSSSPASPSLRRRACRPTRSRRWPSTV